MRRLPSTTNLVIVTAIVLGGFSLSGCATKEYVDQQIAAVNTRIDGVDARAQDGIRRADAVNAAAQSAAAAAQAARNAAQSAATAAQAADASARTANQRLDQVTSRVDTIESTQRAAAAAPTTNRRRPRN
jgi:outer membrane murein-binding lipoprotein Lpp